MRALTIPAPPSDRGFDFYCPICGVQLTGSNYDSFDAEYFCPVCSTRQRPSRAPARSR
jgi:predicted RNA-binding Zn-ribbon protein involved in translation (DUF1610 family)